MLKMMGMMGGAPSGPIDLAELVKMPPCAPCLVAFDLEPLLPLRPAATLVDGTLVCQEHASKFILGHLAAHVVESEVDDVRAERAAANARWNEQQTTRVNLNGLTAACDQPEGADLHTLCLGCQCACHAARDQPEGGEL